MASPDSVLFPLKWPEYCAFRKEFNPSIPNSRLINIWANRYRLAKSFDEIKFREYSAETTKGYNGFFRNILAYSAFEMFKRCFDSSCFSSIEESEKRVIDSVRLIDSDNMSISVLKNKCTSKILRLEIEKYLRNEYINPIHISALIRHAFVHGELTANINGVFPVRFSDLASELSNYLLTKMDFKFSEYVEMTVGAVPMAARN